MGGGGQGVLTPLEITKYRIFQYYWSGSPDNYKSTKPAFNVGHYPPASRLLPAYDGFWSLAPLEKTKQTKNKLNRAGPPLTKLSGSAHDVSYLVFGRIHKKFVKNL